MKKILIFLLLTGILLLIYFILNNKNELIYFDARTEIVYSEDGTKEEDFTPTFIENIDFEYVNEYFTKARAMSNIENFRMYWIENDLYMEFYFSREATYSDIQKAYDFYFTTLVLEKSQQLFIEVSAIEKSKNTQNRILKVYCAEELIVRSRHLLKDNFIQESRYFENHLMDLRARNEVDYSKLEQDLLTKNSKLKRVKISKSFKPQMYFLHLDFDKKVKNYEEVQFLQIF